MAGTVSEVGISPVLLQAITHTLSSNAAAAAAVGVSRDMKPGSEPVMMMTGGGGGGAVGGGEPTSLLLHNMHQSVQQLKAPKAETMTAIRPVSDETIIILQNINVKSSGVNGGAGDGGGDAGAVERRYVIKNMPASVSADLNMGQVLSAIASHLKTMHQAAPPLPADHDGATDAVTDGAVTELIIQTTPSADGAHFEQPWTKRIRLDHGDVADADAAVGLEPGGAYAAADMLLQADMTNSPCPICGDRISGYHYGIYSCESCKGFFKRTVQNKKVFVCHGEDDCDINVGNRKKCPACRYQRCLFSGMKLQAIRVDRTRGGRSSYDGCTPKKRIKSSPPPPPPPLPPPPVVYAPPPVSVARVAALPQGSPTAVLEPAEAAEGVDLQPHTPSLLDDLLAVEALMAEEGGATEQACCAGRLSVADDDPFSSILHLADHCLYKVVRWARNLPQFTGICTDDQIQLLQHSWAELLCVCVCAQSVHAGPAHLRLAPGRTLAAAAARAAGVSEISDRLLDFTAHLRRLQLDSHEFVALKVIILLTPDVPGLQDCDAVRLQQEEVTEALLIHTSTHYPRHQRKFAEMLLRIAELSRTCVLAKELLSQRQAAGEVSPYSLLSELLRGDLVVS